jgi:alkylation response protein AidB-like acyl-CoA dehydrogenase
LDFNDTPEENDFRLEVREWLKNNAPKEKKAGGYDSIDVQESALARARDWQAKKAEAGYAAITWPKEYGGLGGSSIQSVIYSQEESKYNVPTGFFDIGLGMCIPTMMAWATSLPFMEKKYGVSYSQSLLQVQMLLELEQKLKKMEMTG